MLVNEEIWDAHQGKRTLFISLAQERGHTHNEAVQVCITLAMGLEAQDMGDDISDFLFFLLGLSLALICLCWASFCLFVFSFLESKCLCIIF